MRKPLTEADLNAFYRNKVTPDLDRVSRDATRVVGVDLWNTYAVADRKMIWYNSQLYWCHKERIEEGGYISEEYINDYFALRTDTIYIDKSNDALYRWDGSEMIPIGGGGGITVVETDLQTYEGMASHDSSTLYVITSLTPAT